MYGDQGLLLQLQRLNAAGHYAADNEPVRFLCSMFAPFPPNVSSLVWTWACRPPDRFLSSRCKLAVAFIVCSEETLPQASMGY